MRPLFIAGNWKMNKDLEETAAFCSGLQEYLQNFQADKVTIAVAPAFPFLLEAIWFLRDTEVQVAAQDVSANTDGAFTGEVSVKMLKSLGVTICIIGHSERRQYHEETDEFVNIKLKQLLKSEMTPILCIGERLEQRQAGETIKVLESQLSGCLADIELKDGDEIVIAYEPVWAIGTGVTATPEQAQEAHAFIRKWLQENYCATVADNQTILYGGSVKPDNISELMLQSDIDGALIGGASLKLEDFTAMLQSAAEAIRNKM